MVHVARKFKKEKLKNEKFKEKSFTIVELVIVIAVIAILSAVLIPTFSNLIKKANIITNQQAVKQMNTALTVHEVEIENQKTYIR